MGTETLQDSATPLAATNIKVIGYNAAGLTLVDITNNIAMLQDLQKKWQTLWIRVVGPLSSDDLHALFAQLAIPLIGVDHLFATTEPPSITLLGDGVLLLSHIVYYADDLTRLVTSLYMGKNFLLSFLPALGDVEPIILSQLNLNLSNLRDNGPDLLLYHVLEIYLHSYVNAVRKTGIDVDTCEYNLLQDARTFSMNEFFVLRRRLSVLKRNLWAQRSVMRQAVTVHAMEKTTPLITSDHMVLFQQFPERLGDTLNLLDAYIANCNGLLDIYYSVTSNQMNQIMKTLTIFSAVFLPLSFLAGLWGMNFDYRISHWNMPELHMRYGYPVACLIMLTIAISLVIIFYKVGWLQFSSKKKQAVLDASDF